MKNFEFIGKINLGECFYNDENRRNKELESLKYKSFLIFFFSSKIRIFDNYFLGVHKSFWEVQ